MLVKLAEKPIEHQFRREQLICSIDLAGSPPLCENNAFVIHMSKPPQDSDPADRACFSPQLMQQAAS